MQPIPHHVHGDRAVCLQEAVSDVQVPDVVAVVEIGDDFVDPSDRLTELVGRFGSAREDAKQENTRFGERRPERGYDRRDPHRDLLGSVRSGATPREVVRTDHQHHQLGLVSAELSVRHPPKNTLCTVAGDAEVGAVQRPEVLLVDGQSCSAPPVNDRVPHEQTIDPPQGRDFEEPLMACLLKRRGNQSGVLATSLAWRERHQQGNTE